MILKHKKITFFSIFLITISHLMVFSSNINKNSLAPLSNSFSLFLNYTEDSFYEMKFEDLKQYLQYRYPHMINIKEQISQNSKYGIPRKILYNLKNEKNKYREPFLYVINLYPKHVKSDEDKMHEIMISEHPDYSNAFFELYNILKIAS